MEQARILQSFITNMEISKQRTWHDSFKKSTNARNANSNSIPDTNPYSPVQQNMIPVSDDDNDDDDSDDSD